MRRAIKKEVETRPPRRCSCVIAFFNSRGVHRFWRPRLAIPTTYAGRDSDCCWMEPPMLSSTMVRAPVRLMVAGIARRRPSSPEPIYASSLTVRKAVVVELELPFLWTPALGIKCAIFRLNPLKALSGFRDGPSNGEIIRLAFDYKPVSPGWEYKVFILWLNH